MLRVACRTLRDGGDRRRSLWRAALIMSIAIDHDVLRHDPAADVSGETAYVCGIPADTARRVLERCAERMMRVDETGREYANDEDVVTTGLYTPNYAAVDESESGPHLYVDCKGAIS